jgi:Fe2+ or Zn2+ uptake regulation protein/O6-methylguanine-DNA--protein-cysteine methyltransferase
MHGDDIAELLRSHDLRVTPQRRAILQAFRGTPDEHLSAEEVMSLSNAAVPGISRGTVYATLAELAELGLLASVGNPEPVRYETNIEPHDHFRCSLCLRLFDVELGGRQLVRRKLPGYSIHSVAVRAEGICQGCHEYERGLIDGAARILTAPTLSAAGLEALSCHSLFTPVGDLALAASPQGIVRVAYEDHADFAALKLRARNRRGSSAGRTRNKELGVLLGNYFAGDRAPLAGVIDWRLSTDVQADTLRLVQQIPYGEPRSYNLLAGELSAYDCGYLLGTNPLALIIPCHRVTRGSVRLASYVGGADRLRILQELEAA